MIKNQKQYKIAKKKLLSIQEEITKLSSGKEHIPLKEQLILASLNNLKNEMEDEIASYEHLKENKAKILKARNLDDLPSLIIEYKIISGLTQKEFSDKIGIKEQQLQRYEADNFKSITFKNLLKILRSIGLNVVIQNIPIENKANKQSGRNKSIA